MYVCCVIMNYLLYLYVYISIYSVYVFEVIRKFKNYLIFIYKMYIIYYCFLKGYNDVKCYLKYIKKKLVV